MNKNEMFKQYAVNEVISHYKNTRIRQRKGPEVEIEVPFSISASKGSLWVLVILLDRYPVQKPIVQILNATVAHKYIGKNYQINHPVLTNWSQQSSLLFALRSIHGEFDKSPPKLEQKVAMEEQKKQVEHEEAKKSVLFQRVTLDNATAGLNNLSNDELQNLLKDEKAFEDYFLNVKGVKELGDNFSKLMSSLKTQAQDNIKAKSEIDKLYGEYTVVRKEYEDLKTQEQEAMKKVSKSYILECLDSKIDENSKLCKDLKTQFEAGDIDFDQYIRDFRKTREKEHKYDIIKSKIDN
jgi:hypothetical protein